MYIYIYNECSLKGGKKNTLMLEVAAIVFFLGVGSCCLSGHGCLFLVGDLNLGTLN